MKALTIYRCCNAEMKPEEFKHIRPSWFDKKKCFRSYLSNTVSSNVTKVLHDGPKGELLDYISQFIRPVNIECVDYKSNVNSLLHTFDMADDAFDNHNFDVVYFLEDDYLHTDVETILKGAQRFGLVTGFDHLDRYKRTDDITAEKESVAFSMHTNCHWRTAESTTCTWACDKETWRKIKVYARMFRLEDRELFRRLYHVGIRLWTPIKGTSTTVDINTFSPGTDWQKVNDSIIL